MGLLGSKDPSEKMAKLVAKHKFSDLDKYVHEDKDTQIKLAKACAGSSDNSCIDLIFRLMDAGDDDVKIECCSTLQKVGSEHAVTFLQQYMASAPEGSKLREALVDAIQACHKNG